MARKKKRRKSALSLTEMVLPTQERIRHGGIIMQNNVIQAEDPLRIDKLLKNGIIDEMQHLYGMQIITLWTIASRPFLKTSQYQPRTFSRRPDFDSINLSRMTAEDQFYKVMAALRPREHALICRICFEEQPVIKAGRELGLPVNSISSYVREAFDRLGDALANIREFKKKLESAPEEKLELYD